MRSFGEVNERFESVFQKLVGVTFGGLMGSRKSNGGGVEGRPIFICFWHFNLPKSEANYVDWRNGQWCF